MSDFKIELGIPSKIIASLVYLENPLMYLYEYNEQKYFVMLLSEEEENNIWLCAHLQLNLYNKVIETRESLLSTIENSNKLILVYIDHKSKSSRYKEISFEQLDLSLLPNRDSYVNEGELFDVQFDLDATMVERLVLERLELGKYVKIKYNPNTAENQLSLDAIFSDSNGKSVGVEIKYYRHSKSLQERRLKILRNLRETEKYLPRVDKILYIFVIKNVSDYEGMINSLRDFSNNCSEEVEVIGISVYDLLENRLGNIHKMIN